MTDPDPKIVQDLAQEVANIALHDAVHVDQWISAVVNSRYGNECSQFRAPLHIAVARRMAVVKPSWPDEQPQDERDARIAELERELRSLRGTELNPSPMVLDAQAYNELRDEIAATMGDGWDLDEAEISILIKYVRWLAAGQPRDEDGYPIRRETYPTADAKAAQDERDGDTPADLYWPFTGGMDTCYGEHDGEYRECCMRAGLAYALKLHEQQVRASVTAEQDGDVRAVERARDLIEALWNGDAVTADAEHVLAELDARFGPAIAALDARDANGGEGQ